MKFSQKLSTFPPVVCRLLARTGPKGRQRPMTDAEIQAVTDVNGYCLNMGEIIATSWLTSWDGVPCKTMLTFSTACGVNFSNPEVMRKHVKYLSLKSRFVYLRRDHEWPARWSRMHELYREYLITEKYGKKRAS